MLKQANDYVQGGLELLGISGGQHCFVCVESHYHNLELFIILIPCSLHTKDLLEPLSDDCVDHHIEDAQQ